MLFDDFDYGSHTDPTLNTHGWSVRFGAGGPGVAGATWAPENVTFAKEGTNSVMTMRMTTAGSGTSTRQSEILTNATKFKNGTYAARVRFSDAPLSGPDGDRLVQSFFTINDLKSPMADDYAEYDFEYLPNGGWGKSSATLYTTSWETFRPDPWEADNLYSQGPGSHAGWHDLVITVGRTSIVYYVDGRKVAQHDDRYLPERPMSINFNHWLIDFTGQNSTSRRVYGQQVDYVLHVKDRFLTPAQVTAEVAALRSTRTLFKDSVPPA